MAAVCLRDGGLVDAAGGRSRQFGLKGDLSGFRRWTLELCRFKSEQKDPIIVRPGLFYFHFPGLAHLSVSKLHSS